MSGGDTGQTGVRERRLRIVVPPGPALPAEPDAPSRPGPSRPPRQPQSLQPGQRPRPAPGRRPGRPVPTRPLARPGQPARPGQQARPAQRGPWAGAPAAAVSRTPFIVFVTALLGGGLVCLLVINTILAAGSYQITALQRAQAAQAQQVQTLREQVAQESSPSVIASEAAQLGMVEPPLIRFLNLKTHAIISQPASAPGVRPVPGYTP